MMLMQVSFSTRPKIHEFPQRAISSPPMLEMFIVLNEKDKETYQVMGSANNSK